MENQELKNKALIGGSGLNAGLGVIPIVDTPIEYEGCPQMMEAFDAGVEACIPHLADAQRYRWLRDAETWTDKVRDSLMDGCAGLDGAIDEAMTHNVEVTGSPALSASPRGLTGSTRLQTEREK